MPRSSAVRCATSCQPQQLHQQATEQRPWTTSSSTYGSYTPIASRSPFRNRPLIYEPPPSPVKHGVHTQLTSEDVGSFYSSFKPLARPRPASDTFGRMTAAPH